MNLNQTDFLISYLRGTGRTLTARQADRLFAIKNLRARISEIRSLGLNVRTEKTVDGRNKYAVSSRDVWGSRRTYFTSPSAV
jgi:hypothetical protein